MSGFSFVSLLNPVALLYMLFFIVSISLGVYVFVMNEGTRQARVFLALTIAMSSVYLGETFFAWSPFKADAYFFRAFMAPGFMIWYSLVLHLFLTIRYKKIPRAWIVVLVLSYVYVFIGAGAVITGESASKDFIRSGIAWIDVPNWTPIGYVYLALMPTWLILDFYLMFSLSRKAKREGIPSLRRQMRIIISTGLTMSAFGLFFNIIAPAMHLALPSIGHLFLGGWIMAIGFAIGRYRFLVPTMEFASKDIISIAGEVIVVTDMNNTILDCNHAFRAGLGYMNVEGMRLDDIIQDFRLQTWEEGGNRRIRDQEVRILRKDGSLMYAKQKGSYLLDQGSPVGIVFVLSDITELKNQNEILEKKVSERTKLLGEAKDEAERRLKITQIYTRKSVVDIIQKGGDPTTFEPTNKNITVLFSDIRNFTSHSENLDPLAIVDLLNRYFNIMNECVNHNNGEVDKLIGDGLMALFNDPEDSITCAIQMRRELDKVNSHHALRMRLNNGIGLNYGEVTVGNIGSRSKMDWTVIGDIVNTASRMESLTKAYGLPIIISDDLKSQISQDHDMRFIDRVLVKGKKTPVVIHEVFDHEPENFRQLKHRNAQGMITAFGHYRDGDFSLAISAYDRLIEKSGEHKYLQGMCADPILNFMRARCADLQHRRESGLLEDWKGIFEFMEK